MAFIRRDSHFHTYGDYLNWSRTSGDELIDGVAYAREPPAPSLSHQVIVMELGHQIRNSLEGTSWEVFIAPFDVRLPKSTERDDDVDTVVQPDVLITRDLRKLDSRGMRGAPDWLAEVLSPGTARYDQTKKIPVYERAGVLEVLAGRFCQAHCGDLSSLWRSLRAADDSRPRGSHASRRCGGSHHSLGSHHCEDPQGPE